MWTVDYSSLTTKCADSTTNTYSYWTARCKQYTSVLAQPLHYTITTRWLYCVECPQYSIRLEAFRYRCTSCYFLHSTRPSVTWLSSLWWLAACDWVMSALSAMLSTRQTLQKIWEVSCMECTDQGNDFRLIPVVKMETRNPIEGYFGSKFPAICNHCGVMDAWSRKTLKFWDIFVFSVEKQHITVKFSKFCSESFHRNTDWCIVFKFCEIADDGKSVKLCVLLTCQKNFRLALQLSLLRGSRHKSARASPRQYSRVLQIIKIGSLSAQF